MFKRQGILLILAAASGAGKSSIAKGLKESELGLTVSVSVTTRQKRDYEESGKHYHFVSEDRFKEMISNNEFLEYANVFGNHYGTLKADVESKLNAGEDIILDIDWQGATKVAQQYPNNAVGVFILPPNREELLKRLVNRGEAQNNIEYRMGQVKEQMSKLGFFDYVVVNSDFEIALNEVRCILKSERLKQHRLVQVRKFIDEF